MVNISNMVGREIFYNKNDNKNVQKSNLSGMNSLGNQHVVYLKTEDTLYSGGNGTGLSFNIKYAEESTEDNPIVIAKGVDEYGKEFEERITIKDITPSSASLVEMRALEAHYKVDKGLSISSLPQGTENMGLLDKENFIEMFENSIKDMKLLGRFDFALKYMKNLDMYSNIHKERK